MNLAQRIGQEFKTLRDDELSTKQESLVSGTNIKTINGASVLGSGDIDLSTSLSMVGNELRYTNIDGTVQAVDMSPFMDDTTNTVVSASLSGTSIIFTREDATTFTLDVSDLYDDTNLVTSVAGRNGAVILDKSDVGLGSVDNTADSAKNVLSATKLTTARTISLTGDVTGSVSFDGSGNAAITTTVANDSHTHAFANITSKPTTLSGYGITDAQAQDADLTAIAGLTGTSGLLKKTAAGTWTLDTTAYTTNTGTVTSVSGTGSYGGLTLSGTVTGSGSLTLGGTPTGSWPISVTGSSASTTGNAATATKLATARTINGVSFDGTANITISAAAEGLGVGQSWQAVPRAVGVTYNNGTGKAIQVAISVNITCSACPMDFIVNGVTFRTYVHSSDGMYFFIIPAGVNYAVTTNSALRTWWELR